MGERWKNVVGAIGLAVLLTLGITTFGKTAISDVAGLAVAQTTSLWNNVRDAAVGDNISNGILATSLYMYNGTAFDRARGDTTNGLDVDVTRMPGGAQTPADAFANPSTFQGSWSLNGAFNGTTWDRVRTAAGDSNSTGVLAINNGLFTGTNFARERSVSATNNTATTSIGTAYITQLSTWSIIDTDVGATQSTASRAAGGGTVRHVATGVTICRGDTAAAAPALIHLRDGASGAGTILRSWVIGVAAGASQCENVTGLNITGSANTAMTIEFAAAGAATSTSTVSLTGYSTP
jgi:hypothetical protein